MEEDAKIDRMSRISRQSGVGTALEAVSPSENKMEEEMKDLERLGGKQIKLDVNGKFVFKHTKLYLIYPIHISKDFVRACFISSVKSSEIYVSHKNGKSGHDSRTHVCVNFKKQFQSRNPTIFDIISPESHQCLHPQLRWFGDKPLPWLEALDYLCEEYQSADLVTLHEENYTRMMKLKGGKFGMGKLQGWCKEVASQPNLMDALSLANRP